MLGAPPEEKALHLFSRYYRTLPCVLALAGVAFASTPSSGTLTDASPSLTYTAGPFAVPNVTDNVNGTPLCDPTIPAEQCDTFQLTVNVAASDATTKRVRVTISFPIAAGEFDVFVFDSAGNLLGSDTAGGEPSVAVFPAVSGSYKIVVDPWNPLGQSFTATVALEPLPPQPPPASGIAPRFQTYAAPPSAGGAESSGEPSIGVDWNPNVASLKGGTVNQGGVAFFTSALNLFRLRFDDCSSPAALTWTDVTSPVEGVTTTDPIGHCDHFGGSHPGRLFQSQLAGATSLLAFSDDDGNSWLQSQGSGQPAGVDHQTVGGGPYNTAATPPPPPHPAYNNAVYYCSQDLATAFCARSDDGGLTFGPGVPIYNLTQCTGIHGHVKVAPDGTVYVPNRGCGATQAVVASFDNGLTWSVRPIPDSTPAIGNDPSVGVATDGTLYFGYQDNGGAAKMAVSKDQGKTWSPSINVGAPLSIANSVFPAVVAGDPGRAAFFFLGSTTPGNLQDTANYKGIWHGYVAVTYDGGANYFLIDATPNDPVQVGSICIGGTLCGADRNLLDFNDLSIDAQGRIIGAFADGCVAGSCDATSPSAASRSALATVLRQSGGRRMFAAFDPPEPTAPGAPQIVSAVQSSTGTLVKWLAPDNGGATLKDYVVYRGLSSGSETKIATVNASKTSYLDTTAKTGTFYYRVAAENKSGTSPMCGEIASVPAPPPQSPCTGTGMTVISDPSGDQTGGPTANSQLDIQSVSISEKYVNATTNQLTFTMKVANLSAPVQPNSSWTIFFTAPNGTQYFVDMSTASGPTPVFEYGHTSVLASGSTNQTRDGAADASSSSNADGTITIVIADSLIGGVKAGDTLVNINARSQTLIGAAGTGLLATIDSTAAGRYILVGNGYCNGK
jgi:hypothetical protein